MSVSTTIITAIIISFAVSVILCPIIIPLLKKMKFGQYIREEEPKSHQSKAGTPTMGGMIIFGKRHSNITDFYYSLQRNKNCSGSVYGNRIWTDWIY